MIWRDWINTVQQGDCLKLMEQMPPGVVHCVVTSPPYYGLRDYGVEGQLGLEKTPEQYIAKMVEVFREVKRIMHPTGCLWLNMGDSYASGGGEGKNRYFDGRKEEFGPGNRPKGSSKLMKNTGLKLKDLLEMPSRLVLALQADGWWLRCRIPWLKRNAMPESVQGSRWERHRIKVGDGKKTTTKWNQRGGISKHHEPEWQDCPGCPKCDPNDGLVLRMSAGRPTQAVEYVFLLTKSPECYYDGEAVRVQSQPSTLERGKYGWHGKMDFTEDGKEMRSQPDPVDKMGERWCASQRSRRNSDWFFESWQGLWTDENGEPLAFIVNPKPYKRAHFATFSPGLVIPCIRAGTSERGACPECGSPWVRVVEKNTDSGGERKPHEKYDGVDAGLGTNPGIGRAEVQTKTLGWRPTCDCGKEPVPCLICDPFAGTAVTIQVARKMGRSGLGFEISEEYVKKYCAERLSQEVLNLETP